MTQSHCTYNGDRELALIAYLYDDTEADRAEQTAFAAHVASCTVCTEEIAALRGVRSQLARWSPPEPEFLTSNPPNPQAAIRSPQSSWWQEVPVWAQVAAALLVFGVSAGIANLDIKYDASGLSVRTGWSKAAPVAAAVPGIAEQTDPAPWRTDLTALERQLTTTIEAAKVSTQTDRPPLQPARGASADDDVVRRVRALIEASEKRQQNELALRVAEVLRDVHAMRQADLVKIDRTLGEVRNDLGVQVMRDRQKLNTLLVRTGSR
jgi:hypothetical protein